MHIYKKFKLLSIALSSLILISCATNARVDFPVNESVNNELIFQCTMDAIKAHNAENIAPTRITKHRPFNIRFQEDIQNQHLKNGTMTIGNTKTAMHDYPVNLSRNRQTVTLRSSSSGFYYSNDTRLEPSLLKLSESIQRCLPKFTGVVAKKSF